VAYKPVARQRPRNKVTKAVVRQRPACNNRSTVGSGVFYVVCFEAISRDRQNSVQLVIAVQWSGASWLVGERVGELEDCCGSVVVSCCC
jgi:hypothetical protein